MTTTVPDNDMPKESKSRKIIRDVAQVAIGFAAFAYRSLAHLTIVLLVPALSLSFQANATTFDTPDSLGRWITYYYKNPEPQRVAEAVLFASKSGFFREGKASPSFIGFLSGWFSENWSSAESVVNALVALPADEQRILVMGLWYSALPESKDMLKKYAERMPSQEKFINELVQSSQPSLMQVPLEQGPWVLDALWGNFMATGKDKPLARIMVALPWATIKGDIPRLLVGGSAKWSLTSNAVQHSRVLEICHSQLQHQSKEVIPPLTEVILNAEKELQRLAKN